MASEQRLSWEDVQRRELEQVARRHAGEEPVEENLVGLALSGGGIRSATFALGVLETMKRLNLLKQIDYLSTVSGGGYIGSWLTANCHLAKYPEKTETEDAAASGAEVPRAAAAPGTDWLDPAADWRSSIAFLRRYSNYLSPRLGFFSADTWSMVAVWIRNTLLVQLTVILAVAAALLLPRFLFRLFTVWPAMGDWRWGSVFCFLVAVVGIAGNQLRLNGERRLWLTQAKGWIWSAGVSSVLLLAAYVAGTTFSFRPFGNEPLDIGVSLSVAALLLAAAFFAQPVVVKIVGALWRGSAAPEQVNYTQGWVQGVVVVPLMVSGFFLAAVLWGQSLDPQHPLSAMASYGDLFKQATYYWPLPLSIAFTCLWMLSVVSMRRFSPRSLFWALVAPIPVIPVLHALLAALALLLHHWTPLGDRGALRAFVWAPPIVLYFFAVTVNLLIGMLSRQSHENVREWWSRLGAWLGIYGFGWMLVTLACVYGPFIGMTLLDLRSPGTTVTTVIGWVVTTGAGLLAGSAPSSGPAKSGAPARTMSQKVVSAIAMVAPFVFIAGLLIAVSTALHLIVLNLSAVDDLPSFAVLRSDYWSYWGQSTLAVELTVAAIVTGALLMFAGRVDINEFSLNAFYRNRLGRCYIGAARRPEKRHPQNFTGFDGGDDLTLASIAASATTPPAPGPLHLINCALNLGGSTDLALHTRRSASFVLSPYAVGTSYRSSQPTGERTLIGYQPTSTYGGSEGQTTLAQAISVSGAAASPNMGYHTSAVVAFLLTLFNVRLGWWFPNPSRPTNDASPWFSLRYLLMELFGGATDSSRYLMISDGGHFENLAAYELIRRKCRVVIISDAECDPHLQFSSLGSFIRMCEVDFGARIEIDLRDIRFEQETRWSKRSHAIGRIVYGDAPDGVLIYLKASLTGTEDAAVLQYKASHTTFPHESTGDQFYGEDQFESYRRLGRDVADRAFAEAASQTPQLVPMAQAMLRAKPESGASVPALGEPDRVRV